MENSKEVVRSLANYPPDIWGDYFLFLPFDNLKFESYTRQVEALKEMVKDMLMAAAASWDPTQNIYLINSLYRLGVSYHFESQIEEQLSHSYVTLPKHVDGNDYDLSKTAIIFQIFRLYGYNMSCDVFNKFTNGDGKFEETIIGDIKGLISLYEASQFRMHGEPILEEALCFTRKHLENALSSEKEPNPHLKEYIVNALYRPYRRGTPRIEARQYISFYEKEESRNDILLKFAKCDYNRVQLLYQQELSRLLSWYKESNLRSKFPYARHRPTEGFVYAVGLCFEPSYAGRDIIAKGAILIGLVDDTFDSYGSYEELRCFGDAIQRFDISAMEELPADFLKNLYDIVLETYGKIENWISKEGKSYRFSYVKNELKKSVTAQQTEARWRHECYQPKFDEYLITVGYSASTLLSLSQAIIGMEHADVNAYEWLIDINNKLPKAVLVSTRLHNDIVTDKCQEKRGLITGTATYMKQFGVSRKEAIEAFREMIEDTWKDLNEGCMRPTPVPLQILRVIVDSFGFLDVAYKYNDEYTKQENSFKRYVKQLLIEPIPIQE